MLMFMHVTNMNGMYLKWYVRSMVHIVYEAAKTQVKSIWQHSFEVSFLWNVKYYSTQNNAQQKNRWSLWIFAMFFLQERRTIGGFIAPMPCQQTTCKCKILFSFSKKIFKTTEIPAPAARSSFYQNGMCHVVSTQLFELKNSPQSRKEFK